jgi:isocitrate/isopropylmalate dehydrogenase
MTPRKKRYTVACLAGDGVGPELMAGAAALDVVEYAGVEGVAAS